MPFRWSVRRSGPPTKAGAKVQLVIGAIILACAAIAAAVILLGQSDLEDLRDHGQPVQGEVVSARTETRRSRRSSTTTYYYLAVHYRHPGGTDVVDEIKVNHEGYARFCNATVQSPRAATVLCSYNDPSRFTLQEVVKGQIADKEFSAMSFLGVGALVGLVLLGSGWWNLKRASAAEFTLPGGYMPGTRWGPPPAHLPPGYAAPVSPPGSTVPYKPLPKRANPNAAPWER